MKRLVYLALMFLIMPFVTALPIITINSIIQTYGNGSIITPSRSFMFEGERLVFDVDVNSLYSIKNVIVKTEKLSGDGYDNAGGAGCIKLNDVNYQCIYTVVPAFFRSDHPELGIVKGNPWALGMYNVWVSAEDFEGTGESDKGPFNFNPGAVWTSLTDNNNVVSSESGGIRYRPKLLLDWNEDTTIHFLGDFVSGNTLYSDWHKLTVTGVADNVQTEVYVYGRNAYKDRSTCPDGRCRARCPITNRFKPQNIEYSIDGGATWHQLSYSKQLLGTITLSGKIDIRFKAVIPTPCYPEYDLTKSVRFRTSVVR